MERNIAATGLLVCLALYGCSAPHYRDPVKFPDLPPRKVGTVVEVRGAVWANGSTFGAPAPALPTVLSATCDDSCEATLAPRREGEANTTVRVLGKRAGRSKVTIRFVHPTHKTEHTEDVWVTFTEAEEKK